MDVEHRKLALDNLIGEMILDNTCNRLCYLFDRMRELKTEIAEHTGEYVKRVEVDAPYIERQSIGNLLAKLQKDYKKLDDEFERIIGIKREGRITDEMVKRAKEYPIGNLVEVNKQGYALCVNHADKKPSMFCRNNFAYCFSCGFNDSAIGVAMKVWDCSFIEAVRRMNL